MCHKLFEVIKAPRKIGRALLCHYFSKYITDDELYLKLEYWFYMGKRLHLENPQTFNEKLQWLKLYDRQPLYTTIVDKYAVKKYVANIIGTQYIIPTLGVWDKFDDIDFNKLPDSFVLKTTHGGGGCGVVVCPNKLIFDRIKAKQKLEESLRSDIYQEHREWPYKNVPRKIIAEQYLEDNIDTSLPKQFHELTDYKFFCFNGKVDCVMVCLERKSGNPKYYFYDREWNHKPLNRKGGNAPEGFVWPKPYCIKQMFDLAETLSKGYPHLRVDLYFCNNKIYFGELTLYNSSGFDTDISLETDYYFGKLIDISDRTKYTNQNHN